MEILSDICHPTSAILSFSFMKTIRIRTARTGDRKKILEVTLSAFQEYAARMPAERWEHYQENIVETLNEVDPAEQIVAEENASILGAVVLYPPDTPSDGSPEPPEVRLLAVLPAARRRGIGAALMEQCIRRARRFGAEFLTLHTTDLMQPAMRLYEKMGFVRAPDLDIQVDGGVVVKAYRFHLRRAARKR